MGVIGIALPLAAFAVTWGALLGSASIRGEGSIRGSFLRAAVLWGAFVAISAEMLSWFGAIRQGWLGALWTLALGVLLIYSIRKRLFQAVWAHVRALSPRLPIADGLILGGIAAVALLLLVIAWVSPPNNYDSLLYHMARVVHWAQAGSLDHFPSGFEHQLTKPTWAETAILHLRVLWGNDRPANLVQWFSMLASLIGVSAIAGPLGAGRRGQILAATIALSIPMGLLQATSTQNDYVVAFWAVCLAYFVVSHRLDRSSPWDALYVGLSTGLGLLTKGTGYVYAVPLLAWFFWPRRPWEWRGYARDLGLVAVIIVILNLGFWWRNVLTFGGPFGTSELLSRNLTLGPALISTQPAGGEVTPPGSAEATSATPEWLSGNLTLGPALISTQPAGGEVTPPDSAEATSATPAADTGSRLVEPGAQSFLSGFAEIALAVPKRVAQIIAFQLVTPIGMQKRALRQALEVFPGVFDTASLERVRLGWNHEDLAPSPLHMLLAMLTCAGVWFLKPAERWSPLRAYTLAVLFSLVLLPVVIGHGAGIWGIRYVLPFFVLMSAATAVLFSVIAPGPILSLASGTLLVLSLPWTLLNSARPLIGAVPRPTRIESVLTTNRAEILLSNIQWEEENYWGAATEVRARGCRNVGLRLPGDFPEYPFWWILDAPQSGIRIESILHTAYTSKYVDPAFEPCIIICTDCDAGGEVPGFRLEALFGQFSILVREPSSG